MLFDPLTVFSQCFDCRFLVVSLVMTEIEEIYAFCHPLHFDANALKDHFWLQLVVFGRLAD